MNIKLLMHKVPVAGDGTHLAVRGSIYFLIHEEAGKIQPAKRAKIASIVSRALFLNRPVRDNNEN